MRFYSVICNNSYYIPRPFITADHIVLTKLIFCILAHTKIKQRNNLSFSFYNCESSI